MRSRPPLPLRRGRSGRASVRPTLFRPRSTRARWRWRAGLRVCPGSPFGQRRAGGSSLSSAAVLGRRSAPAPPGVAPCMITPSQPRSNWLRTAATHWLGLPVAAGREPLVGDERGDVLELLGGADDVEPPDARPRPDRRGSARARRDPSRSCAPAARRSPGGRWPSRPTVFMSRLSSGMWSPTVAKHDHTFTDAGSRPACSAARLTVSTHRAVVSSVKNVWSTTSSKHRPASSRVFGPKATMLIGRCSSSVASRCRTGHDPAGPSWPTITSPRNSRRMIPAKSSICAVVMRGMPYASCISGMPRPEPEHETAAGEALHGAGEARRSPSDGACCGWSRRSRS